MEYVILVPATEEWDKLNHETFAKQFRAKFHKDKPEELDLFLSNVEQWNQTRKLSYIMYRHCLKQITLKN
jgi:hypothetical protein